MRTHSLLAGSLVLMLALPGCATVSTGLQSTGVHVAVPDSVKNMTISNPLPEGPKPIGWEEERAIGEAIALKAIAKFGGLHPSGRLQRYVNEVGQAVAQTSDRPGIPYHFGVLRDPSPNALACPGGYVFVTVGLLRLVKDESELAGILAHEIAHVADKHALKVIRRAERLSSIGSVTAEFLDQNPEVFDKIIEDATSALFDKGLDQTMETEADAHGVDYLYRVGYDPVALSRVLTRLQKVSGDTKVQLLETHPDPRVRIELITKRVKKRYAEAQGQRLATRWQVRTGRRPN